MSTINAELRWSLFCYDPLTESVSEVLPPEVPGSLVSDNSMGYFAFSPDDSGQAAKAPEGGSSG